MWKYNSIFYQTSKNFMIIQITFPQVEKAQFFL